MPPHWIRNDVSVNGVRLHYHRTGPGEKRPLVLVHGFSDNGLCWMPVARELESEFDVIMPDMRGHGLSARVRPGEPVDMAADLAGFIRALGLERPIVGGHSMGAMISYEFSVRFPHLPAALFLEDPPWRLPESDGVPASGESPEPPIVKWAKSLSDKTLDQLLAQNRAEHPGWSEELVRVLSEAKKQLDPGIIDIMAERVRLEGSNRLTTISGIRIPVLLITGDPELGGIITPEVTARIRTLNPDVAVAAIPDTGHLIRFDRLPAYMDALKAFLERLPS